MSRHVSIVTAPGCGTVRALQQVGKKATGVEPAVVNCAFNTVEDMLGVAIPGEPRTAPGWLKRAREHTSKGRQPWVVMADYDRATQVVQKHYDAIRNLDDDILFVWVSNGVEQGPYR